MRRIFVAVEYVRAVAWGDVKMDDDADVEDDGSEEGIELEEQYLESDSD